MPWKNTRSYFNFAESFLSNVKIVSLRSFFLEIIMQSTKSNDVSEKTESALTIISLF